MRAYELIKAKRDGGVLAAGDIRAFLDGYCSGEVTDYQMSAMCMAVYFRGMTPPELGAWTRGMLESGEVLDLSGIPGVKVDKHSTGGVGDKVSLSLAPLVAACGVPVPMISGRGLGHTGGTLDKLEAIPGFQVDLPVAAYRRLVAEVGACLIGQTATLAPADKKLYALRDVTGTVESIPLISASIMSKKIAEGIDALVLDVKTGSGAFMKTEADSRRLAESLVSIGNASGVKTEAVITDMEMPLGVAVGNALEVIECLDILKGHGAKDLVDCSIELTIRMLILGKVAVDRADAERQIRAAIDSGAALERFRLIIEGQGGDPRVVDDYSRLPAAPSRFAVRAERGGYVTRIDAELVGRASVILGAGRDRVDDVVDPAVGIIITAKPGTPVSAGDAIFDVHYREQAKLDAALALIGRAITIGDEPPQLRAIIVGEVR